MTRPTRRALLGALGGTATAVAGCLGTGDGSGGGDGTGGAAGDGESGGGDWRTASLTDVTTGESFTISELAAPVLAHPFAVWCSTCGQQNSEIDALQSENDFAVVQLNIGDSEGRDRVREYAEENGYADHSRFAVAPEAVSGSLVDEFGAAAVSPPQSPVILLCADGSTHEIDKIAPPETILEAVETNC
jgi:hypothetical protein